MRKVKIITDSCADLGAKFLEKYDIDYVKMATVEDGVETPALLTWTAEEAHTLYDKIRAGKRITTAQVPVTEFQEVFTKYLEEGCDIVYIACSSKLSGSLNTGYVVAQKLLETYTDAKIICVDSLNATAGEGILVIEAAKQVAEGKSAEEVAEYVISIRKKVLEFATVHSLDTFRRNGRVSAASAFFGNLMGVKPILVSDANGAQAAYKKVKGRGAAIKECIKLLKESIIDSENQTVYLWHSDCDRDELESVREQLAEEIPCREIEIGMIGPIVGASIGPSVIGVFALGKEVTFVSEA